MQGDEIMKKLLTIFLVVVTVCPAVLHSQGTPTTAWGKQFGFSVESIRVAADKDDNCFVAGTTGDSLSSFYAGSKDAFVRKIDSTGKILWTINIGTNKDDYCYSVTTDADGNCYVAGKTSGNLDSQNLGGSDAFLVKIDASGKILWKRQFGTDKDDELLVVMIDDAGYCYTAGSTLGSLEGNNAGNYDAMLLKFDADGNILWQKQYGTCYVLLSSKDILFYDQQGNYTGKNRHTLYNARGIVIDDSLNIYIGGYNGVNYGSKAILVKYDKNWTNKWQRTFGSGSWTGIKSMMKFRDGTDDILVGACQSWPNCIAVCRRYDLEGNSKWVYSLQEKNGKSTCGDFIAIDGSGNCFITGLTDGDLFDTHKKPQEVFLSRITVSNSVDVKETGSLPSKFELNQNYPNPFNPSTKISYSMPVDSQVRITVYDIDGKSVKMLLDRYQAPGNYSVSWNGKNEKGEAVSSGIYFYKLETENISLCRKMALIR